MHPLNPSFAVRSSTSCGQWNRSPNNRRTTVTAKRVDCVGVVVAIDVKCNQSTAERGETYIGTKKEVKKACRGVPSQWHHGGVASQW